MTPHDLNRLVITPALAILPERMDTPAARAMLIAIALQESGLMHRRQLAGGPAHGSWQFEPIGVQGVLSHHATGELAAGVAGVLLYPADRDVIYQAIADNDLLACAFARLLLWRDPEPLPERGQGAKAWEQYLRLWAPGRPRPEKWSDNWLAGWESQ